jgi:hypothetical protein
MGIAFWQQIGELQRGRITAAALAESQLQRSVPVQLGPQRHSPWLVG